jgi:hypothetical protein
MKRNVVGWRLRLALYFGALAISSYATAAMPIVTSVCDIVAQPERYANKLVKVAVAVESDGMHYTVLIDRTCPKLGLTPEFPDTEPRHPALDALQNAIYGQGRPGTLDKDVSAVFVGKFKWRRGKVPWGILHVKEMTDLHSKLIEK